MYSLPQEIEVWYIIPAVRRELAVILGEKYKLKQKKIAELLGISEAAISQYMSKKRASEMKFPQDMKKDFEKSSKEIMKDNKKVVTEIVALVNLSKKKGVSCCMCKKHNKGILGMCACVSGKEAK
jgi:predicted transcriptional regulator